MDPEKQSRINQALDKDNMKNVLANTKLFEPRDSVNTNISSRIINLDHECPVEQMLNIGQKYRLVEKSGKLGQEFLAINNSLASEKVSKQYFKDNNFNIPFYQKFYLCNTTDDKIGQIYGYKLEIEKILRNGSYMTSFNIDHIKTVPECIINKVRNNEENKLLFKSNYQ